MTETAPIPPTTAEKPQAEKAPPAASSAAPTAPPAPGAASPAPAAPAAPKVEAPVKSLRIGVVPFLNAQPLLWGLKDHHQLFPAAPNEMGQLLKEGRLDLALAPIVAYFLNPKLQIVPVAAIGCKGPVKTVRILSHGPLPQVEKLYVDSRSQTSVFLARLILKKWFGVKNLEVKPVDMETFRPNQTKAWEATLQFGDNALVSAPTGMTITDLGEEWFRYTQKPFVFAAWMARDVPTARGVEMELLKARDEGVKHFEEIVNNYKGIWVFERPKAKEYLEKNVSYEYSKDEVKGQLEFQGLLKEEGLIL